MKAGFASSKPSLDDLTWMKKDMQQSAEIDFQDRILEYIDGWMDDE